jgi:hypothetical protein
MFFKKKTNAIPTEHEINSIDDAIMVAKLILHLPREDTMVLAAKIIRFLAHQEVTNKEEHNDL